MTERYKLLLHSHVADFIYITRWQHLRCSLFIFPFDCFHRKIIEWTCLCVTYICLLFNREIWFIDVFTLLYRLKNTPTPSLWSHLIWWYCLENYNIYIILFQDFPFFSFWWLAVCKILSHECHQCLPRQTERGGGPFQKNTFWACILCPAGKFSSSWMFVTPPLGQMLQGKGSNLFFWLEIPTSLYMYTVVSRKSAHVQSTLQVCQRGAWAVFHVFRI